MVDSATRHIASTRPALGRGVAAALILAAVAGSLLGSPPAASEPDSQSQPASAPQTLADRIGALTQSYVKLSGARVGLSVLDLRTGESVCRLNGQEAMTPASNQKLLTAAFALQRLGKDFRFSTGLVRMGEDLVLTGDADPTLGDPVVAAAAGKTIYDDLDRWAAAAKKSFGEKPARDLLLRTAFTDGGYWCEDWSDANRRNWSGAPVADLNFNDNCYDVTFTSDGKTVTPVLSPTSRFIEVIDKLRIGPAPVWSLRSSPDEKAVTLTGTVPIVKAYGTVFTPADDPPMLLGRVMADRLERAGVKLTGKIRAVAPNAVAPSRGELLGARYAPLELAMGRSLKRSLNMAAECLLLRAGDGTWEGSAKLMQETLVKDFHLSAETLVVRDGSGLSHGNRVSADDLVSLLRALASRKDAPMLLRCLPHSGIDGSLEKRLDEPACRGRAIAKTGHIAGVSCLSGYVLDRKGQPAYAFSILVARPRKGSSHDFQDELARLLVAELGS